MILLQIPVGNMKNFTYVLGDPESHDTMIIDPSWDIDRVMEPIEHRGLKVVALSNTHHHLDHSRGNDELKALTGAKIYAHSSSPLKKDVALQDGDTIPLGRIHVKVLHTPGHTPDSICLLAEDKLFTGDTLFVGECGRTDLPGGSAFELYHSFFDKLLRLDDTVEVYPGHHYGDRPHSTIGHERAHNYTLKPRSKAEFIKFMSEP